MKGGLKCSRWSNSGALSPRALTSGIPRHDDTMTAVPPIIPPGVITQEFHTPRAVRRGVIAGVAGNVLEWYDFALFGFFAQQIGTHFFPAHNPTASLLAAFGTFAAGFVMRPLGGALFGWVGDKFGRKQALLWSVMAMAFPSFFIGVLPSTETIGIAAPILLLTFRLMQGLAVGGEYGASTVFLVEGAEPGRRGWMGSWGPVGAFTGTLLGSAAGAIVNAVLSPEEVLAWGWRIPFILGIGVGLGGIAIRRYYIERVPHQAPSRSPLVEALQSYWLTTLHLVALVAGLAVGFYMTFVYAATWLAQVAHVPARTALGINTLAMALSLVASLAAGALSDRIGRRPVLVAWGAALALLAYPLDVAHGHREDGQYHRGPGRPRPAGRRRKRRPARHHGRAGAVAGAVHRGFGGAQPGDGAPRRDHAAHRRVAASRGPARPSRPRCTWPRRAR